MIPRCDFPSCITSSLAALVEHQKLVEIFSLKWIRLEGIALRGAQLVDPKMLRPQRLFTRLTPIKEEYVGLNSLGIKQPRRKPQERVKLTCF